MQINDKFEDLRMLGTVSVEVIDTINNVKQHSNKIQDINILN